MRFIFQKTNLTPFDIATCTCKQEVLCNKDCQGISYLVIVARTWGRQVFRWRRVYVTDIPGVGCNTKHRYFQNNSGITVLAKWTFFQTKQSMHDFIIAQSFYLKYCMLLFILYIVNRDSNTGTRQYLNRPPKFLAHQTSSYCYRLINIGQCARNKFANSNLIPSNLWVFCSGRWKWKLLCIQFGILLDIQIYELKNIKNPYTCIFVYKQNHHDIDIIQNIIPSN